MMADDLQKLADQLDRMSRVIEELYSSRDAKGYLAALGYRAEAAIRTRTRRGIGPDGEYFAPYSPSYAALLREAGQARTHVTLTRGVTRTPAGIRVTEEPDSMLSEAHMSTVFGTDANSVYVRFVTERARAIAAKHMGLTPSYPPVPRRPFFALSNQDVEDLRTLVGQQVDSILQDLTSDATP